MGVKGQNIFRFTVGRIDERFGLSVAVGRDVTSAIEGKGYGGPKPTR